MFLEDVSWHLSPSVSGGCVMALVSCCFWRMCHGTCLLLFLENMALLKDNMNILACQIHPPVLQFSPTCDGFFMDDNATNDGSVCMVMPPCTTQKLFNSASMIIIRPPCIAQELFNNGSVCMVMPPYT
ncbi:hypothetical protein AVEN_44357-1 [Araneus ventricosus]|uniref:Uncharacterized protein n=1 Tax=Araneus ventricosus TaxID=182803 RepID=A0A4Y2SY94_ARAVE|nr:hypothetical protein AVEN_44357-1 [Araneus ventricosus]